MLDIHKYAIAWKMFYEFLLSMPKVYVFISACGLKQQCAFQYAGPTLISQSLSLWESAMNCKLSSITKHSNSSPMT